MKFTKKTISGISGRLFSVLLILGVFTSCTKDTNKYFEKIKNRSESETKIVISYPFNNTIFPPDMSSAPTFIWNGSLFKCSEWNVYIADSSGNSISTAKVENTFWKPDKLVWNALITTFKGRQLQMFVIGSKKSLLGKKLSYSKVNFSISLDSVAAPVFCRAVPLPFSYAVKNVNEIEWYIGNIGDKHPKKVLDNMAICANCHSFPNNGSVLAMDVDYANDKGSYTVSPILNKICEIRKEDIFTWSTYRKNDGENTFGLLSQISPDGRYILSTVKDRSVFVAIDTDFAYSQLFFPVKGILVYYDRKTKTFKELNGACDKNYVQSNPSWSPDGQEVIFARSSRYTNEKVLNSTSVLLTISDAEEFVNGTKDFKFDLYKVKFNGGAGSEAEPIEGASNNGKSNYFAKYSPDGKWIVFCKASSFMLLQPDSRLYIMPAKGGTPRLMKCNMDQMNSWHSWSPNSKWIIFSSKNRGPYTQLYMTHIDENGNDSPPVLLEGFVFDKKAVNIPEFYTGKLDDFTDIEDNFSSSPIYFVNNAQGNILNNDFLKAYKNLEKAIKSDPNYYESYVVRMRLNKNLFQSGNLTYKNDFSTSLSLLNKQIAKNPSDQQLILARADIYMLNREYTKAINDAQKVLSLNKKDFEAYRIVCYGLKNINKWDKTIKYCQDWLDNKPDNSKEVSSLLAIAYQQTNNMKQALSILDDMVNKYPSDPVMFVNRAFLYEDIGNLNAAYTDLNTAKVLATDNYNVFIKIAEFYSRAKRQEDVQTELSEALQILDNKIDNKLDDIELLFARASVYKKMNNPYKALEDYYAVLNYLPENYEALINAGEIEVSLKDWSNALHRYEILIKFYKPKVDFYSELALINIQLNKPDEANKYFNKGLEIDPENTSLLFNRAMFFKALGKKESYTKEINKLFSILTPKKEKKTASETELKMLEFICSELKN